MIQKLLTNLAVGFVVCAGSIAGVALTFDLLANQTLSWIPSLFQIFVGFTFMYCIFTALRLRNALRLRQSPIDPNFIKEWVQLNSAVDSFDITDPLENHPEKVMNELLKDDKDDWMNEKPTSFRDWQKVARSTHFAGTVGSQRNIVVVNDEDVQNGVREILGEYSAREGWDSVQNEEEDDEEKEDRQNAFHKDV